MIVFVEQRIVLYTPPKCASTSLWEYFGKRGDALLIAGPDRLGNVDQHYSHPMCGYEGFQQLVVIRNPLDRLCSLFRFKLMHHTEETFDGYIERLANGETVCPFYSDNQDTYLKAVTETGVIRYEHLMDDLRKFGLLGEEEGLPKLNVSPSSWPTPEDISKDHMEKLRAWWEPDAVRFGISLGDSNQFAKKHDDSSKSLHSS